MSNKMKKIISSVAAVIIFIIGAYFYLNAPDEVAGDNTESSYQQVADENQTDENVADDAGMTQEESIQEEPDNSEATQEANQEEFYEFRKQQYLDEHFDKHGSEFDYETADEYLAGANRVINDPNSLYKTESEDGDHIYYLESTNEFVVVSTDGYIRTYFKPSAGIDYFNRQ